jgi:hypothetical protein
MRRPILKPLLHGISQLLFVAAGVAFLLGGVVISAAGKVDRILAEMMGMVIAAGLGLLGFIAKRTAEDLLDDDDDSPER